MSTELEKLKKWMEIAWKVRGAIAVIFLGMLALSVGFSFLLVTIYRSINFTGSWQELASTMTLQSLPHFWRFLIISLTGFGLVIFGWIVAGKHILRPFARNSQEVLERMNGYYNGQSGPNIVVVGGGIGTAQLIRGLKKHAGRISVVVHMTDEGGSTGRLRRIMGIPAVGDIVSNIVALSDAEDLLKDLLLYRFKGERYGEDNDLGGHKLGNLLFAALSDITGDLNHAIAKVSKIFAVSGKVLPVTLENVFLRAKTVEGIEVKGEENIDLGHYEGEKVLDTIWCEPQNVPVNPKVIRAVLEADIIILGPGDLYTTILSNLIFPELVQAIEQSHAFKAYILNVANKPFETKGYELTDFVEAFKRHRADKTFDYIFVNNNFSHPIPDAPAYQGYSFVRYDKKVIEKLGYTLVEGDFLETYMGGVEGKGVSIYHDPVKIAQSVLSEFHQLSRNV